MSSTVEYTPNVGVERVIELAGRKGLTEAAKLALAASDVLAPKSVPKAHPVHMVETGFVRNEIGLDGIDAVRVGYTAWYAVLQHENLAYHHDHGGVAKFLELGVMETAEVGLTEIASAIRSAIA